MAEICSHVITMILFVLLYTWDCGSEENDESKNLARGFGEHFNWRSYSDGLSEAKNSGKPLMLIIHKSWCRACKALKPKFSESPEIAEISKHFVMVNTEDDEEPVEKQYNVDGKYVPRIFFLNSHGEVEENIYNVDGKPDYKYYYYNPYSIADAMKRMLRLHSGVTIDTRTDL